MNDVDVKFQLTMEEQKAVAGLKQAERAAAGVESQVKAATRAVTNLESALTRLDRTGPSFHGALPAAQIANRVQGNLDPALFRDYSVEEQRAVARRRKLDKLADRARNSSPAVLENRARITQAFERQSQRDTWAEEFADEQRRFANRNVELRRGEEQRRLERVFNASAWDGTDWQESNRRSNRKALVRRLRSDRRDRVFSGVAGGSMIAGAAIVAGSQVADRYAAESESYASGLSAAERDLRPIMSLERNAENQGAIRRRVFSQSIAAGTSAGESAGTLYNFYSDASMFSKEKQSDILKAGFQLSRLTDSSAGENLSALIKITNVYGDSLKDFNEVASKLLKTTEVGSVTMSDLGKRLPEIAPAFKAAGYSLDDTLTAAAVGSSLGGNWQDTSTDLRIMASRMYKAEEAGIVQPGGSFGQQISDISKANLSTAQIVKIFGDDALTMVLQLRDAVGKLEQAATTIGRAGSGDLAEKIRTYESDAFTATALRGQRIDAVLETVQKGGPIEGTSTSRAAGGVDQKAIDAGYMATMDPSSKALQETFGTVGISKLLYRQRFKSAGMDIAANASLQASQDAGGDAAAIGRAMEDRVAGGAFRVAMANPSWGDWFDMSYEGRNGFPDRPTTDKDVIEWKATAKQNGWDEMPFATWSQSELLRASGQGDPQAFINNEKKRRNDARISRLGEQEKEDARLRAQLAPPIAQYDPFTPFESVNAPIETYLTETESKFGKDSNAYKAALQSAQGMWNSQRRFTDRYESPTGGDPTVRAWHFRNVASTLPAFNPETLEMQLNEETIAGALGEAYDGLDKARKGGRISAADSAAGRIQTITKRRRELTEDDGVFGLDDSRELVDEISGKGKVSAPDGSSGMMERIASAVESIASEGVKVDGDGPWRAPMLYPGATPAVP